LQQKRDALHAVESDLIAKRTQCAKRSRMLAAAQQLTRVL
jgi:hypothetical protein